jgi:activator of HSP90 ATPase
MSTSIHQEVVLNARPEEVYKAFMDEETHSALTGGVSKIDQRVGGLADMHDGQIVARHIELDPNRRIVQAWRVTGWEDGVYTLLRITLDADGDATRVTLDQTGCPEDMTEHLAAGWDQRYWQPLAEHFG